MCDDEYEWEDCTKEMMLSGSLLTLWYQDGQKVRNAYKLRDELRLSIKPDGSFRIERRVAKKQESWSWGPKVGDWVEYGDERFKGRGKIIAIEEWGDFAVADPSRMGDGWHDAYLNNDYTRLFPRSCRYFEKYELKPVEK